MDYNNRGLSNDEVMESRRKHGSNKLSVKNSETFLSKFIDNFKDPIIVILMVALVIYTVLAFLGHTMWFEAVGIAIAVLVATLVATFSEHKNETSFQELQEEASLITNKVFRDGILKEISVNDIVVGDYVLLQPGEKIPADGYLVKGELKVNQSSLTGEPDDVDKIVLGNNVVEDDKDLFSELKVFRGTVVSDGESVMKVEKVGDKTFYGEMNEEIGGEERDSPLTVKLSSLAKGISMFGYIGASFIAIAYMFNKIMIENNFDKVLMSEYLNNWGVLSADLVSAFILAVIIIVVAVPEGLPMMIAFVLSANMRKLLGSNVLVRKLNGIETAGSMNILFTDKTGTLTKGELESVLVLDGKGNEYNKDNLSKILMGKLSESIKNNTSSVMSKDDNGKSIVVGGNPTDKALLELVKNTKDDFSNYEVSNIITFNSSIKYSATNYLNPNKGYVKGAPEVLLDFCNKRLDNEGNIVDLSESDINSLSAKMDELSERSIRLIAVCETEGKFTGEEGQEAVLVGIVGIRDELREDSIEAVKESKEAGIRVVMVTGDKKETAYAIAKEVGIIDEKFDIVLTSSELRDLSDDEVKNLLPRLAVVSRALPTDKSRLVRIAQSMNLVVGMTGDGVNDSAALSVADVGFAMGSGTEVAKEASSIILLEDNFSAINESVLYGRTIFNNIRKFIVFQMSVNVAALGISFIGPLFGVEMPLTMVQMLWVNLVMDTLAVLAFGGEAALKRYMKEEPKRRDEDIINKDMWSSILTNGLAMAFMSLAFIKIPFFGELFRNEAVFLSAFFALFIFWNNFNKFNTRTEKLNLFEHMGENKGFIRVVIMIFAVQILFTYLGGDILRTVGLNFNEWIYVLLLSLIIIPIDLCRKLIRDYIIK